MGDSLSTVFEQLFWVAVLLSPLIFMIVVRIFFKKTPSVPTHSRARTLISLIIATFVLMPGCTLLGVLGVSSMSAGGKNVVFVQVLWDLPIFGILMGWFFYSRKQYKEVDYAVCLGFLPSLLYWLIGQARY